MNVKRLRKQLTYAVGFVAALVLLVGGPWLLVTNVPRRSTPAPAATEVVQPIEVQSVDVVQQGNVVDVVARLHNPNARVGSAHYLVNFILFDSNNVELLRVPVDSNILPGSVQYISALNIPVAQPVARVTLDIPDNPVYASLASSITLPSFSTFLLERQQVQVGGETFLQQKGLVTNNSAFDWQYVEVTAVATDAANTVVGVGTTFVGRLTSGEQREFTIQWPATTRPTARVVTLASTNIFKEDNIIRAVGDPNLLR